MGAALVCLGCSATARVPTLGIGPYAAAPPAIFHDAVRGAGLVGYQPSDLDEVHGRFQLLARADRTGHTRFAVQCTSDGWIVVRPEGGGVGHTPDGYVLRNAVAAEYARLVVNLETVMPVTSP